MSFATRTRTLIAAGLIAAVASTSTITPAMAQTDDNYLTSVTDNGKGLYTLTMKDGKTHTINVGDTIDAITVENGVLKIKYRNGKTVSERITSGINIKVEGEGANRTIYIVDKNGNKIGQKATISDIHVSTIVKDGKGNYVVTMNNNVKHTINAGDDINKVSAELTKKINDIKGENTAKITEVKTELEARIKTEDAAFYETLKKSDVNLDKYYKEFLKTSEKNNNRLNDFDKRLDALQQCVVNPHIALPALVPMIATLGALAQNVQIPGANQAIDQLVAGNQDAKNVLNALYDARGIAAAGLGVLGLITLIFFPGVCGSDSIAEQWTKQLNDGKGMNEDGKAIEKWERDLVMSSEKDAK